jgi:hypothetical protein
MHSDLAEETYLDQGKDEDRFGLILNTQCNLMTTMMMEWRENTTKGCSDR